MADATVLVLRDKKPVPHRNATRASQTPQGGPQSKPWGHENNATDGRLGRPPIPIGAIVGRIGRPRSGIRFGNRRPAVVPAAEREPTVGP